MTDTLISNLEGALNDTVDAGTDILTNGINSALDGIIEVSSDAFDIDIDSNGIKKPKGLSSIEDKIQKVSDGKGKNVVEDVLGFDPGDIGEWVSFLLNFKFAIDKNMNPTDLGEILSSAVECLGETVGNICN